MNCQRNECLQYNVIPLIKNNTLVSVYSIEDAYKSGEAAYELQSLLSNPIVY